MSKTIGVIFGLLNIIMLSFFVTQFDEKAILKYGEHSCKITEWARNSFVFLSLPTWIMTSKSSSFNFKKRSFKKPEWVGVVLNEKIVQFVSIKRKFLDKFYVNRFK